MIDYGEKIPAVNFGAERVYSKSTTLGADPCSPSLKALKKLANLNSIREVMYTCLHNETEGIDSFKYSPIQLWNSLPRGIRSWDS